MIAGHYTEEQRAQVPFPYREIGSMDLQERAFVERVTEILTRERPRLLFFDRSPWMLQFGTTDFDFQRYFGAAPGFAAELADRYTSLGRTQYAVAGRPVTLETFLRRDGTESDPRAPGEARRGPSGAW